MTTSSANVRKGLTRPACCTGIFANIS